MTGEERGRRGREGGGKDGEECGIGREGGEGEKNRETLAQRPLEEGERGGGEERGGERKKAGRGREGRRGEERRRGQEEDIRRT